MKRKIVFVVLVWAFSFSSVKAQWQTIFKDSTHFSFDYAYFINNDTGFVCGFHYPFTFGASGVIFRTFDGGQTWDSTFTSQYLGTIQFINDSIGFAGGQDGTVYSTIDLGTYWNYAGHGGLDDLSGLYFLNKDTGYQCAGEIYKTINMGANWQAVSGTAGGAAVISGKMLFTDSFTGYAVQGFYFNSFSHSAAISKTVDGGNTWADLIIPPDFYPHSCFFFGQDTGFAVGFNGKISKTNDAGLTWSLPDSIGQYPLMDIYFVNSTIGYITGGNNYYNNTNYFKGIIYKTIDGGLSWQVMDSSYYDGLLKMYFPSDSIGYAVGMNGIILKITNANSLNTSVQNISPVLNTISISPNPASSFIHISYPPTSTQNIKTKIISVTGEIVFAEENKSTQNNFSKTIDVSNFANGIYFLSVQTEKYFVARKVVVQH